MPERVVCDSSSGQQAKSRELAQQQWMIVSGIRVILDVICCRHAHYGRIAWVSRAAVVLYTEAAHTFLACCWASLHADGVCEASMVARVKRLKHGYTQPRGHQP
jgi:hypothetical protein